MKKVLASILTLVMALSLFACGGKGGEEKESGNESESVATGKFMVGYGEADITPTESVPLAGYGNTEQRMSLGMYTYLKTTCAAITDEAGTTILIFGNDLIRSYGPDDVDWYSAVSEATGVPEGNIIFNGSHTHSGPDIGNKNMPVIGRYEKFLSERLVEAAQMALNDRAEAKMYMTRTTVKDMNFQRHFVLADGTKTGYSTSSDNPAVGYAGYKDETMQLLKFGRKELNAEKKDIILTNWQGHNHRSGSQKDLNISADVASVYRDTVNKALDCQMIYINGASGNSNFSTPITADNVTKDFKEQGKALGQYAIDAAPSFKEINVGKIQIDTFEYELQIDHSMDGLIEGARTVNEYWKQTNDIAATKAYGKPYGINSPYHAGKIVAAVSKPATKKVQMTVCNMGDFAFGTFPGEMFAKGGMNVKENSPFEMTFFVGYSNGSNGYFPTEDAYEYVGYETDVTTFVKGCAETVTNDMVKKLQELFATK